jgi:hypothetical protein
MWGFCTIYWKKCDFLNNWEVDSPTWCSPDFPLSIHKSCGAEEDRKCREWGWDWRLLGVAAPLPLSTQQIKLPSDTLKILKRKLWETAMQTDVLQVRFSTNKNGHVWEVSRLPFELNHINKYIGPNFQTPSSTTQQHWKAAMYIVMCIPKSIRCRQPSHFFLRKV